MGVGRVEVGNMNDHWKRFLKSLTVLLFVLTTLFCKEPELKNVCDANGKEYWKSVVFIQVLNPQTSFCSATSATNLPSSPENVLSSPKFIFVTNTTQGNLGGIAGADSICNADSNKPINSGTYKAFIVLPGVRVASVTPNAGDGQIDWVLRPNQLYVRPTGEPIMTTNSAGIFTAFPLTNSVYTTGDPIWTGFPSTSDWTASGGCTSWTSNSNAIFGGYSVGNLTSFQSLQFGGNFSCDNSARLYCVQQ